MKVQQDAMDVYLAVEGDYDRFHKIMSERGYEDMQCLNLHVSCRNQMASTDKFIRPAVVTDPKAVMRKAIEEGAKAWVADTFDAEMLRAMHKAGIIAQPLGFEISCIATLQLEMWERLGIQED